MLLGILHMGDLDLVAITPQGKKELGLMKGKSTYADPREMEQ